MQSPRHAESQQQLPQLSQQLSREASGTDRRLLEYAAALQLQKNTQQQQGGISQAMLGHGMAAGSQAMQQSQGSGGMLTHPQMHEGAMQLPANLQQQALLELQRRQFTR